MASTFAAGGAALDVLEATDEGCDDVGVGAWAQDDARDWASATSYPQSASCVAFGVGGPWRWPRCRRGHGVERFATCARLHAGAAAVWATGFLAVSF